MAVLTLNIRIKYIKHVCCADFNIKMFLKLIVQNITLPNLFFNLTFADTATYILLSYIISNKFKYNTQTNK